MGSSQYQREGERYWTVLPSRKVGLHSFGGAPGMAILRRIESSLGSGGPGSLMDLLFTWRLLTGPCPWDTSGPGDSSSSVIPETFIMRPESHPKPGSPDFIKQKPTKPGVSLQDCQHLNNKFQTREHGVSSHADAELFPGTGTWGMPLSLIPCQPGLFSSAA